ncbi:fatty acid desaturase, partial [Mycobacterium tuberculosis]|nr:fatty acid desaturase [Mycobacterium tuberculosis]
SLQHEALHGHPTRSGWLNELLVSLPLGLFYPYRRYKHLHLKHHADERLTDPYDDPESYYRALGDWDKLPDLSLIHISEP